MSVLAGVAAKTMGGSADGLAKSAGDVLSSLFASAGYEQLRAAHAELTAGRNADLERALAAAVRAALTDLSEHPMLPEGHQGWFALWEERIARATDESQLHLLWFEKDSRDVVSLSSDGVGWAATALPTLRRWAAEQRAQAAMVMDASQGRDLEDDLQTFLLERLPGAVDAQFTELLKKDQPNAPWVAFSKAYFEDLKTGQVEIKGVLGPIRADTARILQILETGHATSAVSSRGADEPAPEWPEQPPELVWPMADHQNVRDAFVKLICGSAPYRFLPVEGASETGKSSVTKQMLGNALKLPDVACARFDFKGSTKLDDEVRRFALHLGVEQPPGNLPLTSRLGRILHELKQRRRPSLLVFDTYEMAGDAVDWVENELLVSLIREDWLRVAVAGQRTPKRAGASWADVACAAVPLSLPPPEDWFDYGREHKPGITLEFVRQAYECCGGKPALLAELLGPAG